VRSKYKTTYFLFSMLSAAIIVYIQGCGIFETREPEPPVNIRSTYITPTSAEIVIQNLEFSILEKNSENYTKCISLLNYQFVPDARSLQTYELIFQSWNPVSERQYFENLLAQTNQNSSSVLFLDNERLTQYTSDSATYQADYVLVFQHNKVNVPKSARGNLSITLAADNDLFYIRRWEDFRQNDTNFTWSEFKANFSY
jgi:hypothetical protein